jgi:hypothetical protein
VLAAAAGLGRGVRLVEHLARVRERSNGCQQLKWGESFPGRQFRTGEKGGAKVGKTKWGEGTKWMVGASELTSQRGVVNEGVTQEGRSEPS